MARSQILLDSIILEIAGRLLIVARSGSLELDYFGYKGHFKYKNSDEASRLLKTLTLFGRPALDLRLFWARYSPQKPSRVLSDRQIRDEVARAVLNGALSAAIFDEKTIHAIPGYPQTGNYH